MRAGIAALALGRDLTIVVKQDGSLWSTGKNHNGQLGDGSTTNKHSFVKVTAIDTTAAATTATTATTNTTTTSFVTTKGTSTTASADGSPRAHPALLVVPIAAFGAVVIGLVICFIVRTIPKRKEVKVVIGRGPDVNLYQSNDDE